MKTLLLSAALSASLLLSACADPAARSHHAIQETPYLTDFHSGAMYRLAKPLFVVEWTGHADELSYLPKKHLVPEQSGLAMVPETVAAYDAANHQGWNRVVAVLPAGTQVRFKNIKIDFDLNGAYFATPVIEVQSSPYDHLGDIDALLVSTRVDNTKPVTTMVNPTYLQLIHYHFIVQAPASGPHNF